MEQKVIKPHYLFSRQESWYVIDIAGMRAFAVDAAAAGVLGEIGSRPLMPFMTARLAKLGLLAEGEKDGGSNVQAEKKAPPPIINIALNLTQSCNLRCVYCYGDGGGYGSGGDMTERTAFQAVDWLLAQSGKIKKLYIGFFGGEPFLNFPLMRSVVAYAGEKFRAAGKEVQFHATTNGTCLDDEIIAFIKEHRLQVQISFDGPKEVQDSQRPFVGGQGSYDAIVPKIKKLLAVMPETSGHAVLVGDTDPERVKNALHRIGFAKVSFMPVSQSLFASADHDQRELDTLKILQTLEREAERWLELIRERDAENLKRLMANSGLYMALTALLQNRKRHCACGAGLGLAGVSAAGDIYLCHRFVGREEYKLGSVFVDGLDRDAYLQNQVAKSEACIACFAKYYCAGGCKHDNAAAHGSAFMPSEEKCRLRRRELELAAVIVAQLVPGDRDFLSKCEIFPPKPCPLDF